MTSTIAWLDFSEQDRHRMQEAISLFKQRDTRDELGLGSIRDAFADLLFPGTSTLQTRARYFLFVPWLYQSYERREIPSAAVFGRLRNDEIRLIRALGASGESDGVIGQLSGASLQRFPSGIYWNGLRTWGIFRRRWSQVQYHRALDALYRQRRGRQKTDDHELVDANLTITWDDLPSTPAGFPSQANLQLSGEEAAYLQEQLHLHCPHSLLTLLVDRCAPVDQVPFAWSHPELAEFPPNLREWLLHAQSFSELLHGATLLYNLLLSELLPNPERVAEYQDAIADWQTRLLDRAGDLARWNRAAFWKLVEQNGRIPPATRLFVSSWLDLALPVPGRPDLAGNGRARALIRDREFQLKRARSRFENRRQLEVWGGDSGTGQMNYRWPIARRIVNDIIGGLGHASSR